ncbi:hypothetical protein BSKO_04923 [Bryopsis sp. KO-2023]|nr:hypothetical protein BSKO_04923 [Bryopsis sp. KO-2023]
MSGNGKQQQQVEKRSSPLESELNEDQRKLLLILAAGLYHRDPLGMNAVPGVGMLSAAGAGAAALLGLTKPRGQGTAEEDIELGSNPPGSFDMAQGEMSPGDKSQQWFRSANRSSCSSTLSFGSDADSGFQPRMEGPCSRTLHEGATVCLYTRAGELLTVRQNGKNWDLHPMSGMDTHVSNEGTKLQFFPWECLFVVMRRDKYIGFRSLGAGGRSLQAVNGDSSTAHRCANFNFGQWESWSPSPLGLVNGKWPQKTLGLEIREVCCVPTDDIRTMEMGYLASSRQVNQQLKVATERALEAEKKHARQCDWNRREVEDLKCRLNEAIESKSRYEMDALQKGAAQNHLESRVKGLNKEKDLLEQLLERTTTDAQDRVGELERELQQCKEGHEAQLKTLTKSHEEKVDALHKNKKRAKELAASQSRKIQDREEERDRTVRDLRAAIREKDNGFKVLLEEYQRVRNILQQVRAQMDEAKQVREEYQSIQAPPVGWQPSWDHRPGRGFVPLQHGGFPQNPVIRRFSSTEVPTMDYLHMRSPPPQAMSACSSQLDAMDGCPAPSCSSSMLLRNPRASPPASAVSGDWMVERNPSNYVKDWVQYDSAESTLGKGGMMDSSASEVNEPAGDNKSRCGFSETTAAQEECGGKCVGGAPRKGSLDSDLPVQNDTDGYAVASEKKRMEEKAAKWADPQEIETVPSAAARDSDELNPPKASASASA